MTNVTLIYSPPREVIVLDPTSEVEVKSNQPQIFFNRLNQQMPSLAGQVLLRPTKTSIFSFSDALRLLAPYSPRLAFNFIDPANSEFQGITFSPVTTATNPIGLVIDQSQGGLGSPGANLTNPLDFTGAGWSTIGALSSVSALSFTNVSGATAGRANTSILQPRKWYKIDVTFTQTSAVNFSIRVSGSLAQTIVSSSATSGTLSGIGYSGDTDELYFRLAGNSTLTITSISVCELPGNHATASSDAKRPLFARYPATGRRNLLTQTEQFGSPLWIRGNSLQIDLSQLDVEGGTRAVRLRKTTTALQSVYQNLATGTYRNSIFVKADTVNRIALSAGASCNLIIDVVTNSVVANSGTLTSVTIEPLTDGWCRISYVNANGIALYMWPTDSSTFVFTTTSATASVFVCLPQAESGSASATAYQKVVTSADITEAGVRDVYASLFDGADDCLQVSGFDLSNTDKVTVIAGVRKLSDAARAVMVEHSATISNDGTFNIEAPTSASPNYALLANGTAPLGGYVPTGFAASITNWISCVYDLGGAGLTTQIIPRLNDTINQTGGFDTASGGNFINSTLNIGGRNNSASLPFNGYLHYLFICGAIVPDAVLTKIYRGLGPRIGLTV